MSDAKDREQWRHAQIPLCMYCDAQRDWLPLSVHEIERRSHSTKRWAALCNLLLLCCRCHMDHFATMPHARQLAVKYMKDRLHYDLDAWLRLRDPALKAPNRVTQKEVDGWVKFAGQRKALEVRGVFVSEMEIEMLTRFGSRGLNE